MALPTLTPEQRSAALQKAVAVRKERAAVLEDLKSQKRSLHDVLEGDSVVISKTKVRRLLESLPGVGKARAGQIMEELQIADGRRVQGLGTRQRQQLLEKFPTPA
ncbi:integration host factor, actinobacterial type [Streptomyces xantholiticus]